MNTATNGRARSINVPQRHDTRVRKAKREDGSIQSRRLALWKPPMTAEENSHHWPWREMGVAGLYAVMGPQGGRGLFAVPKQGWPSTFLAQMAGMGALRAAIRAVERVAVAVVSVGMASLGSSSGPDADGDNRTRRGWRQRTGRAALGTGLARRSEKSKRASLRTGHAAKPAVHGGRRSEDNRRPRDVSGSVEGGWGGVQHVSRRRQRQRRRQARKDRRKGRRGGVLMSAAGGDAPAGRDPRVSLFLPKSISSLAARL